MAKLKKTAVVLLNLGGPDSPAAIRPFLFNFFMDKNIIRLPFLLRWPLARFISWRRSRKEAAAAYGALGGRSPLLENTQAQAAALERALGAGYRVFVCMRYWHPMAPEVIAALNDYKPDHLVLLPLYPQYSTTTTRSAFQNFWACVQHDDGWLHAEWEDSVHVSAIDCYPVDKGFIGASAHLVRQSYDEALARSGGLPAPRILFSAHGLPESVIRAGDPYQRQCEETAAAIAAATGIPDPDWAICYQSRVGPKKWIGPALEDELRRAARDKVPVVVCPHSFTQEHVETLVELDIEYRHKAEEWGIPGYYRVPAVGTAPLFIAGLAALARNAEKASDVPFPDQSHKASAA